MLGASWMKEVSEHGAALNNQKAGFAADVPPMSEINVTPFVDVTLVLLIVFMVTAPLLTVGVPVDLPKTKAGQINADQAPSGGNHK